MIMSNLLVYKASLFSLILIILHMYRLKSQVLSRLDPDLVLSAHYHKGYLLQRKKDRKTRNSIPFNGKVQNVEINLIEERLETVPFIYY